MNLFHVKNPIMTKVNKQHPTFVLMKDLNERDLMEYILQDLNLKWGYIDLKKIFDTKISNKSQNTRFWKKKEKELKTWSHMKVYHSIQI